jgi:hypothetical protein
MRFEAWLSHIFGAGSTCLRVLTALIHLPTSLRLLRRELAVEI